MALLAFKYEPFTFRWQRASGNTLNLNNVVVYVDPTTYAGAYQVLGYTNLTERRGVTLIPGLVAFAGTAGGGAFFTPTTGAITPSSGVVTVNGQDHIPLQPHSAHGRQRRRLHLPQRRAARRGRHPL